MNLLKPDVRNRLLVVLAMVFLSTLAFYVLVYFIYEPLATGAVVAWATITLIFFRYLERKRPEMLGLENQYRELRSFINFQPLLGEAFLPYSFWAMEPGSLLNLLSVIQYKRYRTIVECGSGVSTIAIGKLLKQLGEGHLYSLEEDADWLKVMSAALAHNDLSDYVTLVNAPLAHNTDSEQLWYGLEHARQILECVEHIDLLLVDGPKSIEPLSRYPALPVFAPALDVNSLIVLDDSKRENEQIVLKRWSQSFDLQIEKSGESLRGQTHIRLRSI